MIRTAAMLLVAVFALVEIPHSIAQEQSQFFDSDGLRIHFVEKGTGEPVVLVHGFAASYQMNWGLPGIIDQLAKNYHVIALDNRGHGKSDKPHDAKQYGNHMVKDVIRLLDHLGFKEAHIVGYSMGGFITTKLLTSHPDRVTSAVIGAAGWNPEPESRFALLDEIGDSLESGNGITPLMKALTPEGQAAPTEARMNATNQMLMSMNDPMALAAAIRGMRDMVVAREQLEENKVPVTAIVGAIDPLREGVDKMATVMSNLKLVLIEGADHMSAVRDHRLMESIEAHLATHSIPAEPVNVGQ